MKQNSSRKKTHEPRNEDGKLKKEKKKLETNTI